MTSPAEFDENTTPFIVLGGQKWPIGEMAIRQMRKVRQPLVKLNKRLLKKEKDTGSEVFDELEGDEYDQLLIDPIYWALTVLHPDLKREEFLDLKATDGELINAWFVVRKTSGVFVFVRPGDAAAPAEGQESGEAQALE